MYKNYFPVYKYENLHRTHVWPGPSPTLYDVLSFVCVFIEIFLFFFVNKKKKIKKKIRKRRKRSISRWGDGTSIQNMLLGVKYEE